VVLCSAGVSNSVSNAGHFLTKREEKWIRGLQLDVESALILQSVISSIIRVILIILWASQTYLTGRMMWYVENVGNIPKIRLMPNNAIHYNINSIRT